MNQFNVIERSQPEQPIESHQEEPPFRHLTFGYISWITGTLYSHTLSLPTDEGKLARNYGRLGILY